MGRGKPGRALEKPHEGLGVLVAEGVGNLCYGQRGFTEILFGLFEFELDNIFAETAFVPLPEQTAEILGAHAHLFSDSFQSDVAVIPVDKMHHLVNALGIGLVKRNLRLE